MDAPGVARQYCCELRRRIMLASGAMRRTNLVLGDMFLDSNSDPLCNVQGLQNRASLTMVVSGEFDILAAREVTDSEWNAFVCQFTQASEIQCMCLNGCLQVSDNGIGALSVSLPTMQIIDLRGTKVTNAGIEALAKYCTSLTEICLYNCQQVPDEGIIALAETCKSLSTVNLGSCGKVTD